MYKLKDLTGKKFGRITVLYRTNPSYGINNGAYWLCRCSCGKEKIIRGWHLTSGRVKSCGCKKKETRSILKDLYKGRIYRIWVQLRNRCKNKNHYYYKYYGGRGINVCNDWDKNFKNFYNWAINNGYKENLTIDRIDLDGNYEPSNCRWITKKEQVYNRRNNIWINYNGVSMLLTKWLKFFKKSTTLYYSLKKQGYSNEEILKMWEKQKNT